MAIAARSNRLLGAPGIFSAPAAPVREITGVRRDVAAFFGVAPRGPARQVLEPLEPDHDLLVWLASVRSHRSVPKLVASWNEYRFHFGGFEGPGRLPYAVSAFFAGGGEQAWIVRTVHDYPVPANDDGGRAVSELVGVTTTAPAPVSFFARSEGRWGNGLRANLSFEARPLLAITTSAAEIIVDEREWVPAGTLLRVGLGGDVYQFVYADDSRLEPDPTAPRYRRHVRLVDPVAFPAVPAVPDISIVTASLVIVDTDPTIDRREQIDDLGLHPLHPRFLARAVVNESEFVWPDASWVGDPIDATQLDPLLDGVVFSAFEGGTDRWADVVPGDYFDPTWIYGDESPGEGIASLAEHDDVGLVLVPDLYDPAPLDDPDEIDEPATLCGPDFGPHVGLIELPAPEPPMPGLDGLRRDPLLPDDLREIVELQQALVGWADRRRDLTVLLDVPLGLTSRQALTWRTSFDSPHAASYFPWLDVAMADDRRDRLIRINPSAFAAPIIAERELRLGVQFGPANQVASGAVRAADIVARAAHDELHRSGVNVFVPTRDGIELTGARTLSRRLPLRQLSVARLMTILRLSLEREMQWATFEPNNPALWARVQGLIHRFLTRLFEAGAFRGATTKQAFFVRCDRTTMTANDIDNGRLIALVGVAPAEPIEYIVLEIALSAPEGVRVEVTT